MPDVPSTTCPKCGKVSADAGPVCECGHSYYPRASVEFKSYYTPLTEAQRLSGRGTTGLILGVLSVVGFITGPYGIASACFGILISITGLKAVPNRKAVIGLWCSVVGFVLSVGATIFLAGGMRGSG